MRSWITRPIGAVLVAAAIAITAGGIAVTGGPTMPIATPTATAVPPGDDTANAWVRSGTCTTPARSSTRTTYNAAAAYCSINAAWQAAQPGDQIRIVDGSLGSQNVAAKAGATTPNVVISPAAGATVRMTKLNMVGASNITFLADDEPAFQLSEATTDGHLEFPGHVGSTLVTSTNVVLDGFVVDGQGQSMQQLIWVNGQNDGITLRHFDVSNTRATLSSPAKLFQTDQYSDGSWPVPAANRNIRIEYSTFHDMQVDPGEIHTECIYASAGYGFVLFANVFRNCVGTGNMIYSRTGAPGSNPNPTGFVIANNFMGLGHGPNGLGDNLALAIQGCPFPGTVIANNIWEGGFEQGGQCTSATSSGTTIANNIGIGGGNCNSAFTYDHNTWTDGACSGDNPRDQTILQPSNFVGYTGNSKTQPLATLNLRQPNGGAAALLNRGSLTRFPGLDAAGLTRCTGAPSGAPPGGWGNCALGVGSAPDLGIHEYGAS